MSKQVYVMWERRAYAVLHVFAFCCCSARSTSPRCGNGSLWQRAPFCVATTRSFVDNTDCARRLWCIATKSHFEAMNACRVPPSTFYLHNFLRVGQDAVQIFFSVWRAGSTSPVFRPSSFFASSKDLRSSLDNGGSLFSSSFRCSASRRLARSILSALFLIAFRERSSSGVSGGNAVVENLFFPARVDPIGTTPTMVLSGARRVFPREGRPSARVDHR